MIRCPNCGAPREGDKCEYCGAKFFDKERQKQNNQAILNANAVKYREDQIPQVETVSKKSRPVLIGLAIFCLFGATVMPIMGVVAGAAMYGVFGLMFFVLAKTPKGSVYLFGKKKGIKKNFFIWACIYVAFISVVALSVL